MTLGGGRWRAVTFPSLVGLFIHPTEGLVLFDTGYDQAFLEATRPFPERLYRWLTPPVLAAAGSLADQLAERGLAASDVRWVILSHFHGDHIAGLHAFPQARIACARAGLQAARAGGTLRALRQGVLRSLIPADLERRVVFFENLLQVALPTALRPFQVGADLLGDGSLLAVELPGHCPGHWGLAARGEDDALHFLVADAAWSRRAILANRPPPRVTTAFLGRSRPYRATLAALSQMMGAAPEVCVTPSHCAERALEIREGDAARRAGP